MIIKCFRCKKKFHKKPDRIPMIETKPYCKDCYEIKTYFDKCKRNYDKDHNRNKNNTKTKLKGGKI